MKKPALALILILVFLISVLAGTQIINLANANPTMFKKERYCHISTQSPQSGNTYNIEPVFLNFTVKKVYVSDIYSYFYLLDGQDIQSGVKVEEIQLVGQETISDDTFFDYVEDTLMGQAVLPHLSDGNHNMTVFIGQAKDDWTIQPANIDPFSFTVNFSVDTTTPPSPSPEATETPLNSEPSPTTFVAASAAIVATGSGLSVAYFIRKKKNSKHPTPP